MKKIAILFIEFYQNIISVFLKNLLGLSNSCRFYPTCSEYTKEAVLKHGAVKGVAIGIERLLKCQPFYKSAI